MPSEIRTPIVAGLRRVICPAGRRLWRRPVQHHRREAVLRLPDEAIPIAGKTGTAQGANNYPWNDSSAFSAFSVDETRPYVVTAYLEKSGYGSQAARPSSSARSSSCPACWSRRGRAVRPARHQRHGRRPTDGAQRHLVPGRADVLAQPDRQRCAHPGPHGRLIGRRPMALAFLSRKPDSGLGNIRSSPATPSATSTGSCCSPRVCSR
jgi:hypothetical protein